MKFNEINSKITNIGKGSRGHKVRRNGYSIVVSTNLECPNRQVLNYSPERTKRTR